MFARVLLTQRVDGLHYYNLEERGAGQKEDCQAGQKKKKRLNFVDLVLVPGLEATALPLVIQQRQFQEDINLGIRQEDSSLM